MFSSRSTQFIRLAQASLTASALALVGCQTTQGDDGYTAGDDTTGPGRLAPSNQASGAQPNDAGRYSYTPPAGPGMSVVGLPFPTGDEATSPLLLHQVMPAQVRRNAPFDYEYHITNTTGGVLQEVALILESRNNLDIISAQPTAQTTPNGAIWGMGDLQPGETRVVRVNARAQNLGNAANCVSVSYNNVLCAFVNVVEPGLTLAKAATPRSLSCDLIEVTYEVCNPGNGPTDGVVIRDTLPSGLTLADSGSTNVNIPVGRLEAGECQTHTVLLRAARTGTYSSIATASDDASLTADSTAPQTVVVAPALSITSECPDVRFLGRSATYNFTVTNNGDGPSADTVVRAPMPPAVEFRGASQGGELIGGVMTWSLGALAAGESRTVTLDLSSSQISRVPVTATVSGQCAGDARVTCETEFQGIPAILLEVVDLVDPVEVGNETTYVITVTNQGSAPDTNIRVVATLPASQTYVSDSGVTRGSAAGQTVTFAPVASLAPGEVIEWRMTIRANAPEDSRFAVELTSDRFNRPIRETESTNLYR